MPERTIDTKLRYSTDRGSVQGTIRDTERVGDALESVRKEAERTEKAQASLEQAGARAARAQATLFDSQIKALKTQSDIYGDLSSRMAAFSGLASGIGGNALGGRLMIAADILDATEAAKLFSAELPEMSARLVDASPAATKLTDGLVKMIPGLTQTTASLLLMGGAVGAIGGAVVGLIALLDAQNEAEKQRTQELQEQMDTQARRALFEKNATQQQIDDAKRKAALDKEYADEQAAYYQNAIAVSNDMLNKYNEDADKRVVNPNIPGEPVKYPFPLEFEGGIVVKDESEIANLNKELETYTEASKAAADETAWLNGVVANAAVQAAVDAQAQEEATAKILAMHRDTVAAQLEQANRERTWTAEQVQARLDQITLEQRAKQADLAYYKDLQAQGLDTADAIRATQLELSNLEEEEKSLTGVVMAAAQAREYLASVEQQVAAITQEQTEAWADYRDIAREIADIQADVNDKIEDLTDRFNQETTDKEADYQRQRGQQLDDFEYSRLQRERDYQKQRELADLAHRQRLDGLQEQYENDVEKAREQAHKDQMKQQRDFQLQERRAAEDHEQNLRQASARLDAVAVINELQNYDRDRKRAKEDYDRQQAERRQAYNDQLKDLKQALDDQIEAENDSYRKQQAQADDAHREAEQRQKEAFDRQLEQQRTEYQRQQDERATQYQRELDAIRTDGQNKVTELQNQQASLKTQLQSWLTEEYNLRAAHYRSLRQQLEDAFKPANGGSGSTLPTQYQLGGYAHGQQIWTDPGEFVMTQKTTRELEKGLGALNQTKIQQLVQGGRTNSIAIHQSFGDVGQYTPQQLDRLMLNSMIRALREAGDSG